jgi:hypothetical protein
VWVVGQGVEQQTSCCTLFWGGFATFSRFDQGDNNARAITLVFCLFFPYL